jgi:pimeloyl-ACP methyl ester carboxylesterase
MKSHTIGTDGADLYVEERGSGEPLVLLHGLTGTGRDFEQLFDLDALARKWRLILPDARGHGRSTHRGGDTSIRRCARDLLAILDQLGLSGVRAVGVSLGAKTLLQAAVAAPGRFSDLILVSATPRFPEATRTLFRAFASTERSDDEWRALRAQHPQGDAQIRALLELPLAFADDRADMELTVADLGEVRAKTLLVSGDRDPLYPVELALELYRGIPAASLYVVPGGGHAPVFGDERQAFEQRALSFLDA